MKVQVSIYAWDVLTNRGTFDSQAEAEQWVAYHGFSAPVYEDITAKLEQEAAKAEAIQFLSDTDYKVTKYRDQVDMGITPDLTVEEFQYLLIQRQQAREKA